MTKTYYSLLQNIIIPYYQKLLGATKSYKYYKVPYMFTAQLRVHQDLKVIVSWALF